MSGYMIASGSNGASFNVAQAVNSLSSSANNFVVSAAAAAGPSITNSKAFKVPAHKHAHHLHSIPPREKSTRTLIIDHLLWVHGRTRFSQARAELGMTDRTGGPSASNYKHRRRPENFEEDDEVGSDGEDVSHLKGRVGQPDNPHSDEEDERLHHQDLALAQSLRLRSESIENIVTSMLNQPPPIHPHQDDEPTPSPPSPGSPLRRRRSGSHPHTLPDGVRLRLTLATMINDLFARQTPPPPFRQQNHSPRSAPISPERNLPPALRSIAPISAYSPPDPNYPGYFQDTGRRRKSPIKPNPRAHAFYTAGADPSTANSPPQFRCPRHLHTGCTLCVEAKQPSRSVRGRSNSTANAESRPTTSNVPPPSWKGMSGVIGMASDGGGISGWQGASDVGSGLTAPGIEGNTLRRRDPFSGEGKSSATRLSALIPRFLRLSALVAAELGREENEDGEESTKDGSVSPVVDRSGPSLAWGNGAGTTQYTPLPTEGTSQFQEAETRRYANVLRPSSDWYMLLAGLLTRAVLEGYLSAGWRGYSAVECLLTCGLGIVDLPDSNNQSTLDEDAKYADYDPDELPSLMDAVKMLFPGIRAGFYGKKYEAEEEFETEMDARLRRFYDVPLSTPDLSTHMEDIAWQYPAEPVERAAVRFCEAVARWRGKPELETYKKRSGEVTIESLVHSNPASPTIGTVYRPPNTRKPSIDMYFIHTTPLAAASAAPRWTWSGLNSNFGATNSATNSTGNGKRTRSPEGNRGYTGANKRAHLG